MENLKENERDAAFMGANNTSKNGWMSLSWGVATSSLTFGEPLESPDNRLDQENKLSMTVQKSLFTK